MEEQTPTPAGETLAPQTEAQPINTNQLITASIPEPAPAQPNLYGFSEEQLADMAKFYAANGGYEKVKSRLSNPVQVQEQPQQSTQPQQLAQPQQPVQPSQPAPVPKGFASWQELSVERYFRDLASDPKYANISEQISNGDVLKEMASMGMQPIDENYNVNVQQINQFLALKSASVPTKPTSSEPTNTPTVEYVNADKDITDRNTAYDILRQSFELEQKGLAPHPQAEMAKTFLSGKIKK